MNKLLDSFNNITFRKATLEDKEIIFTWLDKTHVREFWDNSPEHRQDILIFMNGRQEPSTYFNGTFNYWIGLINEEPFSLIMTSNINHDEPGLSEILKAHLSMTGKTYGIDFMIGNDKFLGQQLAAKTLQSFMRYIVENDDPKVDTFFIDPDKNNPRAIHVYKKSGFQIVAEFTHESGEFSGHTAYLMVKKLFNAPKIIPVTLEDYPVMQSLGRFYVYDMSRNCGFIPGWECPSNGLYECFDLKKYFQNDYGYPFLIKINNELAGFVIIDKHGTSAEVDWSIAEFFILAKFQGNGVGKQVAQEIFKQHTGVWESSAIPQNISAIKFWRQTIDDFTNGEYLESLQTIKSLPDTKPHPMILWKFKSHG